MEASSLSPMKQLAIFVAGFIVFFILIGIAGRIDYEEAVLTQISHEAYGEIVQKVGTDMSDIIEEYKLHQEYYDSLY